MDVIFSYYVIIAAQKYHRVRRGIVRLYRPLLTVWRSAPDQDQYILEEL